MTATTQDRDALWGQGYKMGIGVASGVQVYKGTIGMFNISGYIASAVIGATTLAGVIEDNVNNVNGASPIVGGGQTTRVWRRGIFRFVANAAPTAVVLGQRAAVVDNQTVGFTTGPVGISGGPQYLGRIVGFGTAPYNYLDVDLDIQ